MTNEELQKENEKLKLEIENLKETIFEMKMEYWKETNSYSLTSILEDEDFKEKRQLILVSSYHVESLLPFLEEYSYEKINTYFLRLLDESIAKGEQE